MVLATVPLWPDELTGVGTVLLAVVTLAAILSTIVITSQDRARADQRFAVEQTRHEAEVAEERRLAEARLKAQQKQSEDQFRTEQFRITEREQYTEAYQVQVTIGEMTIEGERDEYGDISAATVKRLAALVVNRGRYAITDVEAQFSPDGRSLAIPVRTVRVPASFESLPAGLRDGFSALQDKRAHRNTLAPWDAGIRFESHDVGVQHLAGPYFLIHWMDRWGAHWQHRQGIVEPIGPNQPWTP